MPSSSKLRREKFLDDFSVFLGLYEATRKANDVGVVVLTGEVGKIGARYSGRAHARELVGCHRHAKAGAADKNAQVNLAGRDGISDARSKVGVVDAFVGDRSEVFDGCAQALRGLYDGGFLAKSCMV